MKRHTQQSLVKLTDAVYMKFCLAEPCWLWTKACSQNGYGTVSWESRQWSVHRLFYTLFVGVIAPTLVVDHICKVRNCCNPAHLEAVTQKENVARGNLKATNQARFARQLTCKQGHPFDGQSSRQRTCSICTRAAMVRFNERRALDKIKLASV